MKKILFIALVLMSFIAKAQVLGADMINKAPKTTAQMNAITIAQGLKNGSEVLNSDTNTIWRYNGTIWVDLGAGGGGSSDHGALTGLTDDDHTQYHNDTRAASWLNALYPNLDTDSTNDGDVTQSGSNTFSGTNSFTSSPFFNGGFTHQGTANLQNGDVVLPGSLTGVNSRTQVVSGNDPTGQASIVFIPSGLERALTATPTDITYNGTSLLGGGSGDLWSDPVDSDILSDVTNTRNIGSDPNRFNTIFTHTLNASSGAAINVANITEGNIDILNIGNFAADPSSTVLGRTYYNTVANELRVYNGTSYIPLNSGGVLPEYFLKENVEVATTANITLTGLQTIDGNLLLDGQRVLVKDQTNAAENGIYAASAGAWARATDSDSNTEIGRTLVYVKAGSANFNKFYQTDALPNITVDTDNIVFNEVDLYSSGSGVTDDQTATEVPVAFTPTNYTPSAAEVQGHLSGIDAAFGSISVGSIATGIRANFTVSINADPTLFDVSAIIGEINGSSGFFNLNYAGATGVAVTNISAASTWVYLDTAGALQQQTTVPTSEERREKAYIVRLASNGSQLVAFEYDFTPLNQGSNDVKDVVDILKANDIPLYTGFNVTPNANLTFQRSSGVLLEIGGNVNEQNPNEVSLLLADPANMFIQTQTSTIAASVSDVNTSQYDVGGTATVLTNNRFVAHRLYLFSSGNHVLQLGQAQYQTLVDAKAGVSSESYIENPAVENGDFLGWWIVQEGATDLSNPLTSEFVKRTIGGGFTSGSAIGVLLASNNLSDLDNITTSLTNLGLIDDDTFASATATNFPSSESVQAYVDANSGTPDDDSVTSAKILNGTILTEDISDGALTEEVLNINNVGVTGNFLMLASDVTGILTWGNATTAKANLGIVKADISDIESSPYTWTELHQFPSLTQFENQTILKDAVGGDIASAYLFTESDGTTVKGSHGYSNNAGIAGVYFSNNQSAERVRLLDAGGFSIEAETDMNSNKIINLADPTNGQDGATKAYTDQRELSSNKVTNFNSPNNEEFPTTQAVDNAITSAIASNNLLSEIEITSSRTALFSDTDGIINVNSASAVTYTIPENASVSFEIGSSLALRQESTGPITIAYLGAATGPSISTYAQGQKIVLWKTAIDTWELYTKPDAKEVRVLTVPITGDGVDLAVGTNITPFYQLQNITVTDVYASVNVAPTGSVATFDINIDGVSILSTPITIDATEKTSNTAATPPVISNSSISAWEEWSFDIDGVGSTTAGTTGTIYIAYTLD